MVREIQLVDRITRRLESRGCLVTKTYGSAFRKGDPDLFVVYPVEDGPSLFVAIEVKVPGEEPTPIQHAALRRLNRHGAIAFWTDDPNTVIAAIEKRRQAYVETSTQEPGIEDRPFLVVY